MNTIIENDAREVVRLSKPAMLIELSFCPEYLVIIGTIIAFFAFRHKKYIIYLTKIGAKNKQCEKKYKKK